MKDKKLLLIFVKNPKRGYVKTRLAATVGEKKAYDVYLKLLDHTMKIAESTDAHKQIWYSAFIDEDDDLGENDFEKRLQEGDDLGQRMAQSFREGFEDGFGQILIIGSDCPGISVEIIEEGFSKLEKTEVVIGPSEDGGYYLIGTNRFIPEIFSDIPWSTEEVYPETIRVLAEHNIGFSLLPVLNDIDTEDDLRKSSFE